MSGFVQGSDTTSVLVCKRQSSSIIVIAGYEDVSINTVLSFKLYLKMNVNTLATFTPTAHVIIKSKSSAIILEADISTTSFTPANYGPVNINLKGVMNY